MMMLYDYEYYGKMCSICEHLWLAPARYVPSSQNEMLGRRFSARKYKYYMGIGFRSGIQGSTFKQLPEYYYGTNRVKIYLL